MCKDAIRRAMLRAVAKATKAEGSKAKVAEKLGIKRQAIDQWASEKQGRVPGEHVLAMEEMSGVSRHEMRPDIFGAGSRKVA